MKLTAAALYVVLAPALCAQTTRRTPVVQVHDSPAAQNIEWLDRTQPRSAPELRGSQPIRSVSIQELLIPSKAAKEFQRSQKAFQAGNLRSSNEHLAKAVQIYPNFVQAHYVLGSNFVRLHDFEKALAEYQKAAAIDPNLSQAHHGLSVALYFLGRYLEAETSARRALELDPERADLHYMLGRTLIAQGHVTPEAKELLRQSEGAFPNASLVLAQILYNEGKIDEVVTELRAYLKAPDTDNKPKAECWLAQLNGIASGECAERKTLPDFY